MVKTDFGIIMSPSKLSDGNLTEDDPLVGTIVRPITAKKYSFITIIYTFKK
jgi:hypothetical protein